jgi:hypothetical protein
MVGLRKCVVVLVAAAIVSACAVSDPRPSDASGVLIDAGITGNPEIAGAGTTIEQARSRLVADAGRAAV